MKHPYKNLVAQVAAQLNTTTELSKLTTTDFAALKTAQVAALLTTQVSKLTTDQIVALTTAQASSLSTDQLVEQLQAWCAKAEASGIEQLQEFSLRLRSYA